MVFVPLLLFLSLLTLSSQSAAPHSADTLRRTAAVERDPTARQGADRPEDGRARAETRPSEFVLLPTLTLLLFSTASERLSEGRDEGETLRESQSKRRAARIMYMPRSLLAPLLPHAHRGRALSLRPLLSGADHTLYGWCHAGEDSSPP